MSTNKTLGILSVVLISAFLISGISFEANEWVAYGDSGTNVNGIIDENTTWALENSPYNLTDDVLVDEGVTLTIEPGVTVNFNEYFMAVGGTLSP